MNGYDLDTTPIDDLPIDFITDVKAAIKPFLNRCLEADKHGLVTVTALAEKVRPDPNGMVYCNMYDDGSLVLSGMLLEVPGWTKTE